MDSSFSPLGDAGIDLAVSPPVGSSLAGSKGSTKTYFFLAATDPIRRL